jgi:hypothetical protein
MTGIPVYSSVKTTLNHMRQTSLENILYLKLMGDIIMFDDEN